MTNENNGATQGEAIPTAKAIDLSTMQPEVQNSAGQEQPGSEDQQEEAVSAFMTSKHEGDNNVDSGAGGDADEDDDDGDPDLSLLEDGGSAGTDDDDSTSVVEEDEEAFVEIHSENCLKCNTLIPNMKKSFKSCHYSAGNKHCPGENVKIVMRIPLEDIVPRFLAAEKSGDFDRLGRLSEKLKSKPEWYRQRVADALADARVNGFTPR